jgi:ATP-binding cassette subfamily F protein 3
VFPGYFSQDNAETLTGSQKILELLENEAPLELIPRLRDMLAAFLFRGDDIHKQVSVLSGGEKSRLALVRLLLKPINLLILDEPTNHLDLHSKDVLLDALKGFGGTIIFVSHDRAFIEGLATRVLELTAAGNGQASLVRNFPGDYHYYQERLERESLGEGQAVAGQGKVVAGQGKAASVLQAGSASSAQKSRGALAYEEEKRYRAEKRKLEKEETRLLEEIGQAEINLKTQETALADPAVYSDGTKSRVVQSEIERLNKYIAELSAQWEDISMQLEEQI